MLIIPVERSIDWRRPPIMTVFLIILCCLTYFGWQDSDERRLANAVQIYQEQALLPLEFDNFLSHLHQTGRSELAQAVEPLRGTNQEAQLIRAILLDHSFTATLNNTDARFWGADIYQQWRTARDQLNAQLRTISGFKLGLIPAESRPLTYLTYSFLHADIIHLVGNMLILLMTGIAVEAFIGSYYFVIGYVLCGVFAGLCHALVHNQSYLPMVGASGAIAGVMGMYVAIYRHYKIRFFYSVVVYFGYFRAPALLMLPVWLVWEIANGIWGDTGIAYFAHAGGLLLGGTTLYFGRDFFLQVEEEEIEQPPDEGDSVFREHLDKYFQQLASFNFDAARRKMAQLEIDYPDEIAVLEQSYQLRKLNTQSDEFHDFTLKLLDRNDGNPELSHLQHRILQDYFALENRRPLPEAILVRLMVRLCQIRQWSTVETLIKEARDNKVRNPMVVKILRQLGAAMNASGESNKSADYYELADNLEQSLAAP